MALPDGLILGLSQQKDVAVRLLSPYSALADNPPEKSSDILFSRIQAGQQAEGHQSAEKDAPEHSHYHG